jgi:hypothetical protein
MQRDAQRLQKGARFSVHGIGKFNAAGLGNYDSFAETPVIGIEATEVKIGAEVWVSAATKLARCAGLSRIDRHPLAGVRAGDRFPHSFNGASELVSEYERRSQDCITNLRVEKDVQVAAADPGGLHADEHLTRAGRLRLGEFFDSEVTRTVKTNSNHVNFQSTISYWRLASS